MKKSFGYYLAALLVIVVQALFAGELTPVTGILKTTTASPVVVGTGSASVEIYVDSVAGTKDYDVRNLVSLNFDNTTDSMLTAGTTIKVELSIHRWDKDGGSLTPETVDLTVNSDNRYFMQTVDKDVYKLKNSYRINVEITKIWINTVLNDTLPRFVFVESEIDMERYYNFSSMASDSTVSSIGNTPLNTDCDVDSTVDELNIHWGTMVGAEEYQLEWTFVNDYGTTSSMYYALSQLHADFKHNSTRITTAQADYSISMLYENGYVAYRVRAVGRDYLNPDVSMYTAWSAPDFVRLDSLSSTDRYHNTSAHEKEKNWQYSATFAEEGKKKEVVSYFDGSLHNRQSVTKVNSDKNVIVGETLYDYQGRPSVNILPVPVNFPSCSTSYEQPSLRYYPLFNRDTADSEYSKLDFDLDNNGQCSPLVPKMDTTSGASQYYSPFNPDQSVQQAFVPDAQMYPFSMVEYTPDNTGRIRNQSGVGKEFQLGQGHETQYLYGQPNQLQLDRMFGSEAGDATHYKKNVVIDADGQTSVSYLNQEGKTIATSLAGDPPTDTTGVYMAALASEASAEIPLTVDIFNKDANGISHTNTVTALQDGIEFSTQLLVPFQSTYVFDYSLLVDTLSDSCLRDNICMSCIYNLAIKVVNECGEDLTHLGTADTMAIDRMVGHFTVTDSVPYYAFSMTCVSSDSTSDSASISLTLPPGVYTVSKILTINPDARDFYVHNYLDSTYNSCIKTLNDFIADSLASIDTTACHPTCATCAAALGTRDDFVASGKGTELQYDFLLEQCLAPCKDITLCDNSYSMMLLDVSPGGQYGAFDAATVTSSDQLSVFNIGNYLNSNIYGGHTANWKHPQLKLNGYTYNVYLQDDGTREKVYVVSDPVASNYLPAVDDTTKIYTDPSTGELYTFPENLTNLSDFIPVWNPYFARSLVVYHPEYVYYLACTQHAQVYSGDSISSDYFDSLLVATETFSDAVSNGFINADYDSTTIAPNDKLADLFTQSSSHLYDPFFTNTAYAQTYTMPDGNPVSFEQASIKSRMENKYNNFTIAGGIHYSMVEVAAILARCGNNFSTTPTAMCLNFGTDYYDPSETTKNDSVRDAEWKLFKNFYLSEKRKIQFERMDFYAKYYNWTNALNYGGCNACMTGTGSFDILASGMHTPFLSTAYYSPAPFYVNRQPCSWFTWPRYNNKQKRFISPSNTGLNTASVPFAMYQATGQCPITYEFQQLLNVMAQSHQLATPSPVNMNTVSAFTPDLYNELNHGSAPSAYIDYQWDTVTLSSTVLGIHMVNPLTSANACTFTIDIGATSIPSFDSIYAIQNLTCDSVGGGTYYFNARAIYSNLGNLDTVNIKGSTCINIKDCTFDPVCTPNQFASDVQNLFSVLKMEGHLFTSSYNISADSLADAVVSPTIRNMLGMPNTNLRWNYTSPDIFELYDFANPTTRLKFSFISAVPSAAFVDSATYFTDINSDFNNLFTMNGVDSLGTIVVAIKGKAEKLTSSDTVGISMGTCGIPDPVDCNHTENHVRNDLEALLNELLSSPTFDGSENLFEDVGFTLLLQSYLPTGVSSTTSTYVFDTAVATSYDTLVIHTSEDCTLEMHRNIADAGAHAVNFDQVVAVTDLTGVPPMDEMGNYHDFYFIATFDSAGTYFSDTIRGTSCWPIKNCSHCDSTTISVTPGDSTTTYIPYVYNGWSPDVESGPSIDTTACDSIYTVFLTTLANYNASVYASEHSDSLNEAIYPTAALFRSAGYCSCASYYITYLNVYISAGSGSGLPLPSDIDHYSSCSHLYSGTNSDSYCSDLYTAYIDARAVYNSFVKFHDLGYSTIPTTPSLSLEQFTNYFCNCAQQTIDNITAIINSAGYYPDSTTAYSMTSLQANCQPTYCVPPAPDTAFAFPPYTAYQNPCVAQMINAAIQNAQNAYNQYIDSATTSIAARYTAHCLDALENFNYRYTDKEYHYTLYYYDQAGNLVKTIPPEGVQLLAVDSTADALEQQIIADRTNNVHTVYTDHRMPTSYVYNSLNQLIYQNMPDHDAMELIDYSLPNGLDSRLRIGRTQFLNGGKGYLVGNIDMGSGIQQGYLYTTSNGGNNWVRVKNEIATKLNDVFFASSTVGFAVGNDGIILNTTDGGNSWNEKNIHSSYEGNLNAVCFSSTSNGVVGGVSGTFAGVYYTTSGGTSYASASGFASGDTITGITYDGSNYFASVRNAGLGKIYKSSSGSSWTEQSAIRANDLVKVQYVNVSGSYRAFAVGKDGNLYKTTTASAASWEMIPAAVSKNFRDIYFMNATEGIAILDSIANKGQIYKTSDGGNNWELLSDPGDYYASLQAYTGNKVLATGENGLLAKVILSSLPYGIIKLDKPSYVNDLSFADAVFYSGSPQAVAVGNNDTLYYTQNTGDVPVSWTKVKTTSLGVSGGDGTFKKVLIKDTTGTFVKGVLLTTTGKLYSFYKNTSDVYGFNLATVQDLSATPITSYFFNDIAMDNHQSGYFYAYDTISKRAFSGTIGTSTAPTITFSYMDTVTTQLKYVQSLSVSGDDNNVLLVGDRGTIKYKSNPNSTTTNYSDRSYAVKPIGLNSISTKAANDIYAAGDDGAILSTSNGTSWKVLSTGINENINSIKVKASGSIAAVACDEGKFYAQTIGDSLTVSLSAIDLGTGDDLTSIALNDTTAYVGTAGGEIYHVDDIGASTVNSVNVSSMMGGFYGLAFVPSSFKVIAMGDGAATYQCYGNNSARLSQLFLPPIVGMSFSTANNGYLTTASGDIRHTTDGGTTWSVVVPNAFTTITNVYAVKPDQAIVLGTSKYFDVVNNNTAENPITVTVGTSGVTFFTIDFNENGYGVMGASKRDVYKVMASGSTFNISYLGATPAGSPTNYAFTTAHVFNDSSFIIAGSRCRIYYYKNGTFYQQMNYGISSPSTKTIYDMYFHDDRTGYLVGTNGIALKCDLSSNIMDGIGQTADAIAWNVFDLTDPYSIYTIGTSSTIDLYTIDFSDRTNGFVGGWYNTLPTNAKYAMHINDQSDYYSTRFFYDKLGRMVVSQNTKQFNKSPQAYSYTNYDALGRITQVGEKFENTSGTDFRGIFGSYVNGLYNPNTIDDDSLSSWIAGNGSRKEVTRTYYDTVVFNALPMTQENLRKRVSDVTYEDVDDGVDSTYQHATHYSYDIHGNVKTLVQDNPEITVTSQRMKRIDYAYDLISGKVNKVIYQQDSADMLIHRYDYDADNRITHVWTSTDDVIWNQDAKYFYYAHGPLARVEYGNDKVQGIDYAYTLQGWIKGVNSNTLNTGRDIGQDALNDTSNSNADFAKDAFGYSLGYFNGDYSAISSLKWNSVSDRFEAQTAGAQFMGDRHDLYNGNISHMATTLSLLDTAVTGLPNDQQVLPQAMAYKYDQLNRIRQGIGYNNISIPGNLWQSSGQTVDNMYKNTFAYDANGNILNQDRWDNTGTQIDNMDYRYQRDASGNLMRNRLYHVNDSVSSGAAADDIDDQGSFDSTLTSINEYTNYRYDEIGNLKADSTEEIDSIGWTVYGKIKAIVRTSGSSKDNLLFDYDASGNRIAKRVYTSAGIWKNSTYYVRDAQGNVMSTYQEDTTGATLSFKLREQDLYGSSRIGMIRPEKEMIGAVVDTASFGDTLGQKMFEGVNHLGNVMVVVSDRKVSVDGNSDGITDYYLADVLQAQDYYVFGAAMPGRTYVGASQYRYGMNGKEKDDEIKGGGNSYDFGSRIYDPRLGRWLSIDPLAKKFADLSPYNFVDNSPIRCKDDDGEDIIILSAPKGAGGAGHAAVLIGNDKDGWKLYSKNGTFGSSGVNEKSSGPSNKHPEAGVYFKSLKDFANSESNFRTDENGEVEYTSAFRITTDKATDAKMEKAASKAVGSYYNVLTNSCIDVCTDALEAGGLNGGTETKIIPQTGEQYQSSPSPIPNTRYKAIVKNNKGVDATKSISPTEETKQNMKANSAQGRAAQEDFEQKQAEQNAPANTAEEFGGN